MPSWPITTYDLHGRYNNDYCVFLFQFAGIIAIIFIVEVVRCRPGQSRLTIFTGGIIMTTVCFSFSLLV